MLITPAFAQAVDAAPGANALVQFLPFVIIIGIMYFLILRPQQNRLKEHRAMVAAVRRGDVVVTAGGVIGKVVKVLSDVEIQVEIAEGVRVRIVKGTITDVRSKTEPVRETRRDREQDEDEDADDGEVMDADLETDMDEPERKPAKSEPASRVSNQASARSSASRNSTQRKLKPAVVKKPSRPAVSASSANASSTEKPAVKSADDDVAEKDA